VGATAANSVAKAWVDKGGKEVLDTVGYKRFAAPGIRELDDRLAGSVTAAASSG
jgi:hypothetical protein